jgi:hypothetical protein
MHVSRRWTRLPVPDNTRIDFLSFFDCPSQRGLELERGNSEVRESLLRNLQLPSYLGSATLALPKEGLKAPANRSPERGSDRCNVRHTTHSIANLGLLGTSSFAILVVEPTQSSRHQLPSQSTVEG